MKKIVASIVLLVLGFGIAYAASGDLFSTGKNDEFRVASDGGVITAGANTLSGSTTLSGASAVSGQMTFSIGPIIPVVDVTVSSPTVTGQIVRTSTSLVYVSTGTGTVSSWSKIGGQ